MASDGDDKSNAAQKIGAGHAKAMLRQGLHEVRGLIHPNGPAQSLDHGIWGIQTQGEIADARSGVHGPAQEREAGRSSVLSERLKEADARAERAEREPPTKERGLDRG